MDAAVYVLTLPETVEAGRQRAAKVLHQVAVHGGPFVFIARISFAKSVFGTTHQSANPSHHGRGGWKDGRRFVPAAVRGATAAAEASLHIFGRIIPDAQCREQLAALLKPVPAPGMVAARGGHVFVLERHIRGKHCLVHDSNSGRHRTRIHSRSIAGFKIVNPHRFATKVAP